MDIVEQIIDFSALEAGIDKEIKKELKVANLSSLTEYNSRSVQNAKLIYERPTSQNLILILILKLGHFLEPEKVFINGHYYWKMTVNTLLKIIFSLPQISNILSMITLMT